MTATSRTVSHFQYEPPTEEKPASSKKAWLLMLLNYTASTVFWLSTLIIHKQWWSDHYLTMLNITYAVFLATLLYFHTSLQTKYEENERKWVVFGKLLLNSILNYVFVMFIKTQQDRANGIPVLNRSFMGMIFGFCVALIVGGGLIFCEGAELPDQFVVYTPYNSAIFLEDSWAIKGKRVLYSVPFVLSLVLVAGRVFPKVQLPWVAVVGAVLQFGAFMVVTGYAAVYYSFLSTNFAVIGLLLLQLFCVLAFELAPGTEAGFSWAFVAGLPLVHIAYATVVLLSFGKYLAHTRQEGDLP